MAHLPFLPATILGCGTRWPAATKTGLEYPDRHVSLNLTEPAVAGPVDREGEGAGRTRGEWDEAGELIGPAVVDAAQGQELLVRIALGPEDDVLQAATVFEQADLGTLDQTSDAVAQSARGDEIDGLVRSIAGEEEVRVAGLRRVRRRRGESDEGRHSQSCAQMTRHGSPPLL